MKDRLFKPNPEKPYKLVFWYWYETENEPWLKHRNPKIHSHMTEEDFESLSELNETKLLAEEVYKDTPRPVNYNSKKRYLGYYFNQEGKIISYSEYLEKAAKFRDRYSQEYRDFCNSWDGMYRCSYTDFRGEAKYWGYAVLDYTQEKILGVYHDEYPPFEKGWKKNLRLLDRIFRKDSEVPENYQWLPGEYEGWLQFRWGDGLNAIDKEDARNQKKKSPETTIQEEKVSLDRPEDISEAESIQDEYDRIDGKRIYLE